MKFARVFFLTAICAGLLLASVPAAAKEMGFVTANGVDVRREPTDKAPSIIKAYVGQAIQVDDFKDGWVHISFTTKRGADNAQFDGWIPKKFCRSRSRYGFWFERDGNGNAPPANTNNTSTAGNSGGSGDDWGATDSGGGDDWGSNDDWSDDGGDEFASAGDGFDSGGGDEWGDSGGSGGSDAWGDSGDSGGSGSDAWGDSGDSGGSDAWGDSGDSGGSDAWGDSGGSGDGGWGDSGDTAGNDGWGDSGSGNAGGNTGGNGGGNSFSSSSTTTRPRSSGSGLGTGLSTDAGLGVTFMSYSITSGSFAQATPMRPYVGVEAQASYYFMEYLGAGVSFGTGVGSLTAEFGDPINKRVRNIGTNINKFSGDVLARYPVGPVRIKGNVGLHMVDLQVNPILDTDGTLLFLNSNRYLGGVIGAGVDLPLMDDQLVVGAGGRFWLAPGLKEGQEGATGTDNKTSGIGFGGHANYKVNDQLGAGLSVLYQSFSSTWTGDGNRFAQTVTNAQTTNTFMTVAVTGAYVF